MPCRSYDFNTLEPSLTIVSSTAPRWDEASLNKELCLFDINRLRHNKGCPNYKVIAQTMAEGSKAKTYRHFGLAVEDLQASKLGSLATKLCTPDDRAGYAGSEVFQFATYVLILA
ncbi:hypothetical protein GPECTOR_146g3 [Gonium pectorale]|uniref:Uncharacterized protein n=1 Tax=Gonium pectorale TaxID=33097 RepID=A0A150FXX1_GONPE|nr:hypothetical protein GPECTOR_146g3 [Gonium pectorale]|eukprot:KXZ42438.1 hypothetical protein GPECTOR_146g3 [Gonium pectorale]